MGLMGFALFLFIVGAVFYANPSLGTDLRVWSDRVAQSGIFTRPPEGVITSAVLFFFLSGVSAFVTAALRLVIGRRRYRAMSDVFSGIGAVIFAFLLSLYANFTISGQLVLATEAAAVGILLLVYISLGMYWSWMRHLPRPETRATTPRP
jgi:uncharacterized membrane protein